LERHVLFESFEVFTAVKIQVQVFWVVTPCKVAVGWTSETLVSYHDTTTVYPKVSGLAAWSENYKWYSSLPLAAVVSLFCESV
jgi:hypothetical protein